MSAKLLVPLISITIRRDANTITPTSAPEHELNVLRKLHGKENIIVGETVGTVGIDTGTEYERLSNKYGEPKIAATYGEDESRIIELVEKNAAKLKADSKADAKSKTDTKNKGENKPDGKEAGEGVGAGGVGG